MKRYEAMYETVQEMIDAEAKRLSKRYPETILLFRVDDGDVNEYRSRTEDGVVIPYADAETRVGEMITTGQVVAVIEPIGDWQKLIRKKA